MLVNRTIREPREKLYLLFKFIKDQNLAGDLFVQDQNLTRDFFVQRQPIVKFIYVKHDILCGVLRVRTQVFNSWFKRGVQNYGTYSPGHSDLSHRESGFINGYYKYKYLYLPLGIVVRLVYDNYFKQEIIRNRVTFSKFGSIREPNFPSALTLYNTMEEWHC